MKRSIANALLTVGSLVAAAIVFELCLAFFWPQKITTHPYHEQYNEVMGWVNKPRVAGPVTIARNVSFYRTHNSDGLRMLRDVSREKPAGVRRVLLVGDSFFWGYGVDDRFVISQLLQQKLGDRFEVINGAVTGYGTDQELLWLTEEGLRYQPDLVILGFFPTNDLDEISTSVSYGYPKPYFGFEGGRLVVHNIPVPDTRETRRKAFEQPDTAFGKLKKFLRHHTHTYPFIAGRLNSIPALRKLFVSVGLGEEYTRSLPGIRELRLNPDKVQALSDALILEMQKVCTAAGADFLLVHIPRRETGEKEQKEAVYGKEPREWNDQVSTYLAGFTRYNSMKFLDLLPVVRQHESAGEVLYNRSRYDHHWTRQGHAVAADAIAQWISRNR